MHNTRKVLLLLLGLCLSISGIAEQAGELPRWEPTIPEATSAPQDPEAEPTPMAGEGAPGAEPEDLSAGEEGDAPPVRQGRYGKTPARVDWPVDKPELDAFGYPLSGEIVFEDDEQGLWFYASPTLVVRIDRIFNSEEVRTWYEAHVFCDLDAEHFGSTLFNPEKPQKKHVQGELIARQNQVVFAMNTDYYTYRMGMKTKIGMIIRNRQLFFDRVPEANRGQFPNLDTLAMYEDGHWAVYHSDELTADQYLADGAVDVFAFGPYLVRDFEPNPFIEKMRNGKTDQPRCALGMIEPGHYYAVLAEGRMKKISIGVSVAWLQQKMLEAGCECALNFDGGQTALMTFMGRRITRIGSYSGGRTSPRETTEIMGIGHSAQIDVNMPKTKK